MANRSPLRERTSGELLSEHERPLYSSADLIQAVDRDAFPSLAEMEASMLPEQEDFTRGLRSTAYGLEEGRLDREADKAIAAGDPETGAKLRARARGSALAGQHFAPRIRSHTEVETFGDAVDFAQSGLGQVTPTMVPPIAAGLAAGAAAVALAPAAIPASVAAGLGMAAGASIPAFQMEAAEQAASQQADPFIRENTTAEERLREQNIKGIQNAALEILFPAVLGGRVVGGAARRLAGDAVRRGPLRRTLAVGRETGIESGTEFTQTLTGQASLSRLNPNRDTSHDYIEQIDSAILGALGGGGMSLGTTVPGYLTERIGQRLGRAGREGAQDLGRAGAELELRAITRLQEQGQEVGLDVPLRSSFMHPVDALEEADRAEYEGIVRRYIQADTAGDETKVQSIVEEAGEFFARRHPGLKGIYENILSRQAVDEGRGEDVLRLSQTTQEPTAPDINLLPDQPIAMFPEVGTKGTAKFQRRHILRDKGEQLEPGQLGRAEKAQLFRWKNQGFISESGMDAAQSVPLGEWLEQRNASPEEVQAEADTMLRDLERRYKGSKTPENQERLETQIDALKSAETYGDLYEQLNEYSVLQFPPGEVEGRFTPQDADLQRRSLELVTGENIRERAANRKKLIAEEEIRVKLSIGGHKKGRRVIKRDIIAHARDFFRQELSSFPEGQRRDEAALLMGVFADPRVTGLLDQETGKVVLAKSDMPRPDLLKNPEAFYVAANLEDPKLRTALKLDRSDRGFKFGKKPQDPAFSRAPEDQASIEFEPAQGEVPFDDPAQREAIKIEQLTAQRLRAEERLAEAKPKTPAYYEAEKTVKRLTNQLTRYYDEATRQGLVDRTNFPVTEENPIIEGAPQEARPNTGFFDSKYERDSLGNLSYRKDQPPIGSKVPRTEPSLAIPSGRQDLTSQIPEEPPVRSKTQEVPRETSNTPEFDKLPSYQEEQKSMTYAGIGSRSTPSPMLIQMRKVATRLAEAGYTLNSGGAQGADSAFEAGATKKNIFKANAATAQTRKIASEIHPAWGALKSPFVRNLMARNTNQIFGQNLDTPVDFVLAWTLDGAETSQERSQQTGGTGQAIDMASRKGIPVINLAKEGWEQRLEEILSDVPRETSSTVNIASPYKGRGQAQLDKGVSQTDVDLGAALTNVTFSEYQLDDVPGLKKPDPKKQHKLSAEGWYQANKTNDLAKDKAMMQQIIEAKFKQYPELVKAIDDRGGVSWIENSEHKVTGRRRWEGVGRESNFLDVLANAYEAVSGVPRGTPQQETWRQGLPEHTIDRNLKNPDGTKRLASARDGKPVVNPVESVEEFFAYFKGQVDSPTSTQKLKVLGPLVAQGWPLTKIRNLITTPELANRFLVLHEQDHIDHNDIDVYWKQGKDFLTPDKIAIEVRATKNALDQLAAERSGIKSSMMFSTASSSQIDTANLSITKALQNAGFKFIDPELAPDMTVIRRVASKQLRKGNQRDTANALSFLVYNELDIPFHSEKVRNDIASGIEYWLKTGKNPHNVNSSLWVEVLNILRRIVAFVKGEEFVDIMGRLSKELDSTLQNPYKFSFKPQPGKTLTSFQGLIDRNKPVDKFFNTLGDVEFALTGSMAYADQTTMYRNMNNPVHDIDVLFRSIEDVQKAREKVRSAYGSPLEIYDFKTKQGTHIIGEVLPKKSQEVRNFKRKFVKTRSGIRPERSWEIWEGGKKVGSYALVVDKKTGDSKDVVKGDIGLTVDYMIALKDRETKPQSYQSAESGKTETIQVAGFVEGFEAKLELLRPKDVEDLKGSVPSDIKSSRMIPEEDVANSIILGRWAKNLREKGFQILKDKKGEYYVVDKDGNRVSEETENIKSALNDIPHDLRYNTLEEALEDPEIQVRKEAAIRWLIRAFGPEIIQPERLGWMLARDAPGGIPRAGFYTERYVNSAGELFEDFMMLAVDSLDPLSFAFHEGMHKFVAKLGESGNRDLYDRMVKAATAPHVLKQMERMLADYPRAIADMRRDPEEAVAYAFQFYAASRLPGGPEFRIQPSFKELLTKIVHSIARMLGIMTHARASQKIFDALFEGRVQQEGIEPLRKYQERSFKQYAEQTMRAIRESVPRALSSPIIQLQRLKNADGEQIQAFVTLANMLHSEPLKGGPSGYTYQQSQAGGQFNNRWHKILVDHNVTEEDMKTALFNKQAMREPSNPFEEDLRRFFNSMYDYQFVRGENPTKVLVTVDEETGRKDWVTPDRVRNYWPRIWSIEEILANEIEFREVMAEESDMTEEVVTNFIQMLQATNGVEVGSELQQYRAEFSPYNKAINARVFTFIKEHNAHKFAKFQEQNMDKVMSRYIRQATHRREHSRTFKHDGGKIKELLLQAQAEGATPEQIAYAEKVVKGIEGRLGTDSVSDMQREVMVASMSITNFAVLAMATLSSMVDPLGVLVRTGSLKASFNTFKAGFAQILNDARKTKTSDQELTEYLGIIEEDMVQDMLNNMERGIYMNEKLRKVNKFFFKSIGLEQWTRGTRIGAMRASLEYLKNNANSAALLEELGLEVGMIQEFDVLDANGNVIDRRIKIKPEEFNPENPRDAYETARKVQNAIFRMVEESILRPSAATRPLWASDMRFRLLGHLKSYTFTWHNQILRQLFTRAGNAETRAQAALVFMPLLTYIPVMLAADVARDMIQGDDKDRDLDETVFRAIQRSAILGMGTFLMDIEDELDYGGLPTNTVLGPVIDSTLNLGRTALNPDASLLNAGANLLPYNALWGKWGDD